MRGSRVAQVRTRRPRSGRAMNAGARRAWTWSLPDLGGKRTRRSRPCSCRILRRGGWWWSARIAEFGVPRPRPGRHRLPVASSFAIWPRTLNGIRARACRIVRASRPTCPCRGSRWRTGWHIWGWRGRQRTMRRRRRAVSRTMQRRLRGAFHRREKRMDGSRGNRRCVTCGSPRRIKTQIGDPGLPVCRNLVRRRRILRRVCRMMPRRNGCTKPLGLGPDG